MDPAVDGDVVPLPVADCVSVLDVVAEREPEPLLEGLLDPVADPLPVADAEALPLAVAELDAEVDGEVVPLPVADCVSVLDGVAEREPEPLLEELLELVADPLSV